MNKKHFIQHVIIRSLPALDKLNDSVRYAEQLWQQLTEAGYGAAKQAKPRESVDYYKQMNSNERSWFDQFWNAFNHKHDRNSAAMQWLNMNKSAGECGQIIEAAKKEAQRPLSHGQVRKMAQGWLADFRYLDNQPAAVDQHKIKVRQIKHDLQGLQRLHDLSPSTELKRQMNALHQKLRDFNEN